LLSLQSLLSFGLQLRLQLFGSFIGLGFEGLYLPLTSLCILLGFNFCEMKRLVKMTTLSESSVHTRAEASNALHKENSHVRIIFY